MDEQVQARAKVLGKLIQDARLQAGRSVGDCAQILGKSAEDLVQIEEGEAAISLPDLEVLALYLRVPMSHFWGGEPAAPASEVNYGDFIALRQRMIGAHLRQARLQAKLSREELSEELDGDADLIAALEQGTGVIPIFELEKLAKRMGLSLDHFSEGQHGPLAKHEAEQKKLKRFNKLPPEVQAFVVEPINLSYLETAMRLSEMDVNQLRGIAEGILDITF